MQSPSEEGNGKTAPVTSAVAWHLSHEPASSRRPAAPVLAAPTPTTPVMDPRPRAGVTRSWLLIALVAALAGSLGIGIFFAGKWRRSSRPAGPPAASLMPAGSMTGMRLKGKTSAVRATAIQAPLLAGEKVGTLTITTLIPSGSRVKRGDLLVEFDRQAQLRDFIDKQAESIAQDEKVIEEQATETAARAKDETAMLQAESDLSKARLEMQKVELLSSIDAEKAQEDLDQAQATLSQLKETFDLKRKAAHASLRILEIQRDRTRETMLHAQANAALMQIRSPIDGIVVFNTIWKEGNMGEVKDGDQVRPGVPFMQVVDPSLMEVQVPVNQEDLLALKVGEMARVHLEAYPDLTFEGQLKSIDPMGKNGDFSSRLRSFAATFSIMGSDPRLMPDLSAAVDMTGASGQAPEQGPSESKMGGAK